jgi:hypothetical protein
LSMVDLMGRFYHARWDVSCSGQAKHARDRVASRSAELT